MARRAHVCVCGQLQVRATPHMPPRELKSARKTLIQKKRHVTNLLEDGVEDVEVVVEVDAVGRRQLLVVVRLPLLEHVQLHRQIRIVRVLLPAAEHTTHAVRVQQVVMTSVAALRCSCQSVVISPVAGHGRANTDNTSADCGQLQDAAVTVTRL